MSSFGELINKHSVVLVDFHATWCGPCKSLAPILKDVKAELGEKISIIKVDVDKNQPLAAKFQVRGVPTMLLFKDGKQVWRESGVVPKQALIQELSSYL